MRMSAAGSGIPKASHAIEGASAAVAPEAYWPIGQDRRITRMRLLIMATVLVVAGILRVFRLDSIVLRQDEGFTLLVSRQSCPDVFGLHAMYDVHPPGYFTLVRISDLIFDDYVASRAVSVIAALLTLPLFAWLVTSLLDARAGLAAMVLLAVTPNHVLYARIGRGYETVVLLAVISWLALVRYRETGGVRWAAIFGIAIAAAMYVDYAAFYFLFPQALILIYVWWDRRKQSPALFVASILAAVALLPWAVTQLPSTIRLSNENGDRQTYLGLTGERIWGTIRDLIAGGTSRAAGNWWQVPWTRDAELRNWIAIAFALACIPGIAVLIRRPFAFAVTMLLTIGTPLSTLLASSVSPGWDERTILPSVAGLCIVLAAPLAEADRSRIFRWTGGAIVTTASCIWIVTLPVLYTNQNRIYRVDQVLATIDAFDPGPWPVLTVSVGGMNTDLIEVYGGSNRSDRPIITFVEGVQEASLGMERWSDRAPTRMDVRMNGLTQYFDITDPANDVFWLVSSGTTRQISTGIQDAGYIQLLKVDFGGVSLHLYARAGTELGEELVLAQGNWVMQTNGTYQVSLPINEGIVLVEADAGALLAGNVTCRSASGKKLTQGDLEDLQPGWEGGDVTFGAYCGEDATSVHISATVPTSDILPKLSLRYLPATAD